MHSIIRSIACLLIIVYITPSQAQEKKEKKEAEGPYKLCLKADIPITAIGIAGTVYGFTLRESKDPLDSSFVANLSPQALHKFNIDATKQNNKAASAISDVLLAGGFVFPWALAFDDDIRRDLGTVSLMYLETMALTGMGYWLTAGLVNKNRPYVYNNDVKFSKRISKHSRNSFYGGHPSVTAAGTFFMAQVFSDYHPDSKFKYVLWSFAGAATLTNAYCRYKGGFHFPSDIAIGVGVGTAIGIAVPILHRKRNKESNLSFSPYMGEYNGVALTYTFKK